MQKAYLTEQEEKVSLSEQELRVLQEIEQSLMAEDPKFGRRAFQGSDFGSSTGRVTLRGIALVAVGLLMLIGGVALAQQSLWFVSLSILGFLVMFASGVWMLRGGAPTANSEAGLSAPGVNFYTSAGGNARTAPRGGRSGSGKPGKSEGFGSRLEENFRRRFEDNQ